MKFKHKLTGIVEDVTNVSLIPQYLRYSDVYKQVKEKDEDKPKTAPKPKSK